MKKATEMCNIANNARNKKVKKQLESKEEAQLECEKRNGDEQW